jgi:hypothetical protein
MLLKLTNFKYRESKLYNELKLYFEKDLSLKKHYKFIKMYLLNHQSLKTSYYRENLV